MGKFDSMEQTHGKVETPTNLRRLQNLAGIASKNHFGVTSLSELEAKMADMGLVDLQRMSISVWVSGSGDRLLLKKKITDAFDRFSKDGGGSRIQTQPSSVLKGRDKESRARRVLELSKT